MLQYFVGLLDLGHDVVWLELLKSTDDPAVDGRRIDGFLRRFHSYGFRDRCAILYYDGEPSLESARVHGLDATQIRELVRSAELMWNLACGVREPLLSAFRHPVLVDLDPGHLQVSALTWISISLPIARF